MKQAWNDLKSFVTISMIVLLFIIVIANLFGMEISQPILLLVTNLISNVLTYYFAKKNSSAENKEVENQLKQAETIIKASNEEK